ncbi:hypothetical protein [Natronobeatus ordinarius]|uniref:hypothetical protein n=1 Tax=Natronobeatus ordinarius TaxID=2963433 RepID=UPI0020CEBE65|nr:hypothetical protein [Natronobeatus ordinarius]
MLLALAGVAAGAYLPWVRPNPDRVGETDAIPDILLPKMNAGIEEYSILLLLPAVAVLVLLVRGRDDRLQSLGILCSGIVALSLPLYYLSTTSLAGFGSTFVPTYGWYLSVAGGVLLTILGLIRLS